MAKAVECSVLFLLTQSCCFRRERKEDMIDIMLYYFDTCSSFQLSKSEWRQSF